MKPIIKSGVLALKLQKWRGGRREGRYKHTGKIKLCGKANYFVRCVFLILHAYIACVYIYICTSPFSPFYLQLEYAVLQLIIKWVKNLN